jgi:hypothetical protein
MPTVPTQEARAKHEEAFRQSEGSVRLEGIDPLHFPVYLELKERILSGEITSDQATDILLARYTVADQTAA